MLTSVDNEGISVVEVLYSFAFGLSVTRTTAKMNTLLDHFVWELNTAALMLLLCYAICLCLCDCLHMPLIGHNPKFTILLWIHQGLLTQISKTQVLIRTKLFFPWSHVSWCALSFSSLFCLLRVSYSLCFFFPSSAISSLKATKVVQIMRWYKLKMIILCNQQKRNPVFQGIKIIEILLELMDFMLYIVSV